MKLLLLVFLLLASCLDRGSEIGNPLFPGDSIRPDTIPGKEYSSFIPYSSYIPYSSIEEKK